MLALLGTVFLASLLGSLHCAGMCGGFVAFYAGHTPGRARKIASHLAYNGGRLLVYAIFGLVAGFVGAALDLAGSLAGLQRVTAVAAGIFILLWGVVALLRVRGIDVFRTALPSAVHRFTGRIVAALADCPPVLRALVIGLLTTFLPCGWLYAFVFAAAGTGSAIGGFAVMMAFWAGTVPILLALGVGVQMLAPRLLRRLPTLTAAALLIVGLVLVFGRVEHIGLADARADGDHPGTVGESIDYVKGLDHEKMPCCGGDPAAPQEPAAAPKQTKPEESRGAKRAPC